MQQLLTRDEEIDHTDVSFSFPFALEPRALLSSEAVRPLWLSAAEAELLVSLCVSAAADGGDAENELFSKLGSLVRSFSR
jgi:hypothetical protein